MIRKDEIRLCKGHFDYRTPLLYTFAFRGAEFWCPYCGALEDIFGGERVQRSDALAAQEAKYLDLAKPYLRARASRDPSARIKVGEEFIPSGEIPEAMKIENEKALADWKYEVRL